MLVTACAGILLLVVPARAAASGGHLAFDGGTTAERGQVRAALDVSSFDWDVVPGTVVVHIRRGVASQATPREIWLDSDLLDSGSWSWGVVQHEYAHEIDYLVLTDADRAQIQGLLGGSTWCAGSEAMTHDDNACERFATAVSWAYWSSPRNAFDPARSSGESWAHPGALRAILAKLLGVPNPSAVRVLGSAAGHTRH